MKTCQMTVSYFDCGTEHFHQCGKPAKYKNPKPEMGVNFICGIHARSLNKMFERIESDLRCKKL